MMFAADAAGWRIADPVLGFLAAEVLGDDGTKLLRSHTLPSTSNTEDEEDDRRLLGRSWWLTSWMASGILRPCCCSCRCFLSLAVDRRPSSFCRDRLLQLVTASSSAETMAAPQVPPPLPPLPLLPPPPPPPPSLSASSPAKARNCCSQALGSATEGPWPLLTLPLQSPLLALAAADARLCCPAEDDRSRLPFFFRPNDGRGGQCLLIAAACCVERLPCGSCRYFDDGLVACLFL